MKQKYSDETFSALKTKGDETLKIVKIQISRSERSTTTAIFSKFIYLMVAVAARWDNWTSCKGNTS